MGNQTHFDLLLRGGMVIDGTGAPAFRADIGIRGRRIEAVGALPDAVAGRVFEIGGRYVTPGFLDIHTHSDISVLYTRDFSSALAQGVTLEVAGNCGFSVGMATPDAVFGLERRGLDRYGLKLDWHSLSAFLDRVLSEGIAIHFATLVGHGTLRKRVLGLADRKPDAGEMAKMQRHLEEAMAAGALGLSSGLEYVPGMYADVAELTALARTAKACGGFYATHLRDEGDRLEEAVAEAIAVAEGADIALQLSHHKAEKPANWGKVVRTLATIEEARGRGVDILLDQYPYTAYQTSLATIALPGWAVGGTPRETAERFRAPESRARVRAELRDPDWNCVEISTCPNHRAYQGRRVADLAQAAGQDPGDWVLDLLAEGDAWVSAAHFAMCEEDIELVLADPHVMIGSDAVAASPHGPSGQDRTHPRTYGTFARILSRYVRERRILSLEEAVRRMTSLPARRLGLSDRGRVSPGAVADLTVLRPDKIEDIATFADPHQLSVGVDLVVVAGVIAYQEGVPTGSRSGEVLRISHPA